MHDAIPRSLVQPTEADCGTFGMTQNDSSRTAQCCPATTPYLTVAATVGKKLSLQRIQRNLANFIPIFPLQDCDFDA